LEHLLLINSYYW